MAASSAPCCAPPAMRGRHERALAPPIRQGRRRAGAEFLARAAVRARRAREAAGSLDKNRMLDAWLRIGADGSATVFTGKVELGQGILTALAQIAAEELDLPLSRIAMISGDTARTPGAAY